ncbi:MAG: 50S ribosomal protein L16 [Dehalococcoidia bacterium]
MLQPKRVKYRKAHRGRRKGVSTGATTLEFGEWGLKALEPCWLTARQIEAARRAISRHLKRAGQVWIRVFPDKPVSKKPLETRMGGGKGAVEHWVAVVKRGRILFEVGGLPQDLALEALRQAADKLPIPVKVVHRSNFLEAPAGEAEG